MVYDFQKLQIWQEGMELLLRVYRLTATYPQDERYGLTEQLRRAANSVIANIAVACGRHFNKDKVRILYQSRGEVEEVKSHLLVAINLKYGDKEESLSLIEAYSVEGRRINAFILRFKTD
jgi:four helix bundle protein